MNTDIDNDTFAQAIAAGGVAFGVAGVLAPDLLSRSYGMRHSSPGQRFMTRLWGTRNLVIGGLMFVMPKERRTLAMLDTGMNVADSVIAFTASGLPGRTRVMAGLTSAGFAAATAVIANSGD